MIRNAYLMVIVSANDGNNEVIVGQSFLALKDLIENNGSETDFESYISLFGRVLGEIKGIKY